MLMDNKKIKNYIVYCHINKINGKKYIGITCQLKRRWRSNGIGYKGCPAFWLAINKYGWQNFQHIILKEKLTNEEAEKYEQQFINNFKTCQKDYGYNIAKGGSAPMQGRHHTEKAKIKISKANSGRIFTKQHKQKLSQAHKGKTPPNKGKKLSNQLKQKLSQAHKGEKNPKSKKVLCIQTQQIFINSPEAAQFLHKDRQKGGSNIARCARGDRQTAYGFHWKYVQE